jgi:hypothetical protein
MEAFILADRVVTLEHMASTDHKQPKYIKKYDLPTRRARRQPISRTAPHKENAIRRSHPACELKVRNLLSTITEGMGGRALQDRSTH